MLPQPLGEGPEHGNGAMVDQHQISACSCGRVALKGEVVTIQPGWNTREGTPFEKQYRERNPVSNPDLDLAHTRS